MQILSFLLLHFVAWYSWVTTLKFEKAREVLKYINCIELILLYFLVCIFVWLRFGITSNLKPPNLLFVTWRVFSEIFTAEHAFTWQCVLSELSQKLLYTSCSQLVIISMFKHGSLWNCYQKYQSFVVNILVCIKENKFLVCNLLPYIVWHQLCPSIITTRGCLTSNFVTSCHTL